MALAFDSLWPVSFAQDIDECSSAPCLNGATCSDEVNGYTCQCADGWEGTFCETSTLHQDTTERGTPEEPLQSHVYSHPATHRHGRVRIRALSERRNLHRSGQWLRLHLHIRLDWHRVQHRCATAMELVASEEALHETFLSRS